ncbi:uncharacterized protein [Euwallacea fornicatus]|uniref:uncharacterized protein isoform X2 n=1 Tax=Euwallacea fornicatus TaxID=995702 RepID=UPI00338E1A91
MKLTLFIAVVSFGHFRELLAKSLLPGATIGVRPDFANSRLSLEDRKKNNRELLKRQMRKLDVTQLDTPIDDPSTLNKDEVEQSFILVKMRTIRERGKRYIQQRSHLTPCLLKICNMGRKRQTHYM